MCVCVVVCALHNLHACIFTLQQIIKSNPLGTVQAGQTQRFYFDSRGCECHIVHTFLPPHTWVNFFLAWMLLWPAAVILPGQKLPILVMFKSANAGVFSEQWLMETRPCMCRGAPIILSLRGIAFQEDRYREKRNQIEVRQQPAQWQNSSVLVS